MAQQLTVTAASDITICGDTKSVPAKALPITLAQNRIGTANQPFE
jgi:hypothetical protein